MSDSVGRGDPRNERGRPSTRADATRTYLMSKGIGGDRIAAVGHGADSPIASNDTSAGRAENRRTEIVVVSR